MECKKIKEGLSAFLDDELSAEEKVFWQNHFDNCASCRDELAVLRKTADTFSSLGEMAPPANFRRELYHQLAKSIVPSMKCKKKSWFQRPFFFPAAIAIVLLVVFVSFLRPGFPGRQKLAVDGLVNVAGGIAPRMESFDLSEEGGTPRLMSTATMVQNNMEKFSAAKQMAEEILERKLIKNAEIVLWVDDYEASLQNLKSKVSVLGGYITNETVNVLDSLGNKKGYLEARIPCLRFDEFFAEADRWGKIKNSHIYSRDVTEEFIDVQSRLRTMSTKEERLLDILQKTGQLSDILAVENELANTRAQLESLEGRLRYLNNQTEFSTFNLTIEQVVVSTQQVSASGLKGVSYRAREAFIRAINNILLGTGMFLVFLSAAIPYLVVITIVSGVVLLVIKFRRTR